MKVFINIYKPSIGGLLEEVFGFNVHRLPHDDCQIIQNKLFQRIMEAPPIINRESLWRTWNLWNKIHNDWRVSKEYALFFKNRLVIYLFQETPLIPMDGRSPHHRGACSKAGCGDLKLKREFIDQETKLRAWHISNMDESFHDIEYIQPFSGLILVKYFQREFNFSHGICCKGHEEEHKFICSGLAYTQSVLCEEIAHFLLRSSMNPSIHKQGDHCLPIDISSFPQNTCIMGRCVEKYLYNITCSNCLARTLFDLCEEERYDEIIDTVFGSHCGHREAIKTILSDLK